ncbi:flagellar biosynthesis, cell-distal portion of basal-body rod [Klebsiella quasipneumoniae]|nr:flagellar biosynthesis, cell-distal portion of basal-body rod [Klebsiella quasipneumoniae]
MAFNPELGSTSPAVLLDNATRLDNLLNSLELAIPDREGVDLDTWRGIMAKVASSIDDIRQNLIPLSKQYQTLAAAQADIANIPLGATTYYRSPDDSELAIEVMNVSGTLQPTGRKMPSQQAIDALLQYISSLISNDPSVTPFVQWEDVGGFILAQLDKDYLKTAGFEVG